MATIASPSKFMPPQSWTATVRLAGQDFSFRLYARPLHLRPFGSVQYYWMDSSLFRNFESETSSANFRNCVGHWWAAMQANGFGDDLEQQTHLVTAMCYPLVCRSKGMQDIYRDAFLAPNSVHLGADALPDKICRRIRRIVRGRDGFAVQREMDATLGRFEPPAKALPALQEAFRHWVGKGVTLLRRHGTKGLEKFLAEADYWLSKYRKRSGRWARHFINLFAYEAKVAFFRCYANTWIDLIPWLREHRGLDLLSERFLRFWHNQNQPVEVAHGRTVNGIYYPTRGGTAVFEPMPNGRGTFRSIEWKTEHIGPTHVPDVFRGQVLSLHPLSGFFMKDPGLCAIAGRFFASESHDDVMIRGRVDCADYWNLIGAILSAAHLYKRAAERQAQGRGVRHQGGDVVKAIDTSCDTDSEATLLEDYADAQKICCPHCGSGVRLRRYHPAPPGVDLFQVEYVCRSCGQQIPLMIGCNALADWLLPEK